MGSLLYLTSGTRRDLAAVVNTLCRYRGRPGEQHWEGVKRVLRYLKGTVNLGLMYEKAGDLPVHGYSDASHGDDVDTIKGKAGYVFLSARAAVSWKSSLLETVTHSSCESEYLALSSAGNEAIYLSQMQGELGVGGKGGVLILGDNESSMKLAENPVFHKRSKHIEIN